MVPSRSSTTRRHDGLRAYGRSSGSPGRNPALHWIETSRQVWRGGRVVSGRARGGREALRITWTPGPGAQHSSAALERRALAALATRGKIARQDGDLEAARKAAARVVEAVYVMPLLAHATMEPPNALIELRPKQALLVASLQSPGGASRMVSAMTGIARPDIEIRLRRVGGGFGRGLQNDFVAEAVLVAQGVKAPVKVVWTREDDLQNDFYRPFGLQDR